MLARRCEEGLAIEVDSALVTLDYQPLCGIRDISNDRFEARTSSNCVVAVCSVEPYCQVEFRQDIEDLTLSGC
ncbi:hypothetical protein OG394_28610 [Kribbella sp. NBC_01245]|uniref:hypothetical protein n=1 Tax=Kribbella sp. NBC_01245 TaxID=2903578 RepID=UPI002E2E8003|nr:hypothetical protein [Kribbella sp. NBC_01245]